MASLSVWFLLEQGFEIFELGKLFGGLEWSLVERES